MSTKPFDATLKELIEGAAAAMPQLLGPWPFRRVELIDADLSTMVAAADKSTCASLAMRMIGSCTWKPNPATSWTYPIGCMSIIHCYGEGTNCWCVVWCCCYGGKPAPPP